MTDAFGSSGAIPESSLDDVRTKVATLKQEPDLIQASETKGNDAYGGETQWQTSEAQLSSIAASFISIDCLPVELLLQIFTMCCLDIEDDDDDEKSALMPVTLSHVCSKWHAAMVSNSALWSKVFITGVLSNLNAIFLARSMDSLLDIKYHPLTSPLEDLEAGVSKNLLPVLTQHHQRIRSIIIACHREKAMQVFLHHLATHAYSSFPHLAALDLSVRGPSRVRLDFDCRGLPILQLRRLRICSVQIKFPSKILRSLRTLELARPLGSARTRHVVALRDPWRYFKRTPNLLDLLITNVEYMDFPAEALEPPITLTKLRSLKWSYPQPRDVYLLLRNLSLPSLERLELRLAPLKTPPSIRSARVDSGPPLAHLPVLVIPSLRELTVQLVDSETLSQCFRRIEFPLLEQLEIVNECLGRDHQSALIVLPRFESILPSVPFLTSLTLSRIQIIAEYCVGLLGYVPALTHLVLDSCVGASRLLLALTESTRRCPKLDALSIWNSGDITGVDLIRLVDSRLAHGHRTLNESFTGMRMIKPLKRTPRGDPGQPMLILAHDHAQIASLRVYGCPCVSVDSVRVLEELVQDVRYG